VGKAKKNNLYVVGPAKVYKSVISVSKQSEEIK